MCSQFHVYACTLKKGSKTVYVRISQEIPYSFNQDFDRYTIEIASGRYSYELFYTKSLDRGELAAKLEEVVKGYSAKAKERGLELGRGVCVRNRSGFRVGEELDLSFQH